MEYAVEKLFPHDFRLLTELYRYDDEEQMLRENSDEFYLEATEIYVIRDGKRLAGELHVRFTGDDPDFTADNRRVYFFAFRVRRDLQGKGLGQALMNGVIDLLERRGYREFTVGVEDFNFRAAHIYEKLGFSELVARKCECCGENHEYDLLLRRAKEAE